MDPEQSPAEFAWRRPRTFLAVAMAAATTPRQFFTQMPLRGGFLPPLLFFVAVMTAPTLVRTLYQWSQGPQAMLTFLATSLLFSLVFTLAFAFVLYCVCRFAFKASLEISDVLRIVCYASGVRLLEFLPLVLSSLAGGLLNILIVLFVAYLVWVGLQNAGGLSRYQALGALLLSFVVMLGLSLMMGMLRGTGPLPVPASPDAPVPATQAPPAGKP